MTKFIVPDMSCNHCTATIRKAVTAADAAADLQFDLDSHSVKVTSALDDAALAGILEKEGYPATVAH
jgi:copper chaperone